MIFMENDFQLEQYSFIAISGRGTKVLVIGGGKAAKIKINSFLKRGFTVHCISKDFSSDIIIIKNKNFLLLNREYEDNIIDDYHLIVICTNDLNFNKRIMLKCNEKNKIYIDTTVPEESRGILCASRETKSLSFGIKIKAKNPKAAVFLADKTKQYLGKYDEYIDFISKVRNNIKDSEYKIEILEFICSEDYIFFYEKGYGEHILNLFYGG